MLLIGNNNAAYKQLVQNTVKIQNNIKYSTKDPGIENGGFLIKIWIPN